MKNKPCKRNNRQKIDNTKNAVKQDNAEERPVGTLAVALTGYSNTPKSERPVYFGSMNLYKINGQNVSVEVSYMKINMGRAFALPIIHM